MIKKIETKAQEVIDLGQIKRKNGPKIKMTKNLKTQQKKMKMKKKMTLIYVFIVTEVTKMKKLF